MSNKKIAVIGGDKRLFYLADELNADGCLVTAVGNEGGTSDIDGALPYIIRTMAASSAGTVIFPIQDILGHGSDTRMNTPSVASGNWGYRITRGQLDSVDRKAIYHLFKTYGRI